MQELSVLRGMNIFDFPFAAVKLWPRIRMSSAITQMKSLLGHSLSNKMIIKIKKHQLSLSKFACLKIHYQYLML